ncbi:hypothetical protein SRIMM317S_05000 [Streptomyces rimosus subsp. rimosus]
MGAQCASRGPGGLAVVLVVSSASLSEASMEASCHASEIVAPRIEPLSPPYGEAAGEALELLGYFPIQLFRGVARRPELARSIAGWGQLLPLGAPL